LDEFMQDDRFFQKNQIENHLASIFDDLPGFIYFVKDLDLRYVAYNQRLCEIFEADPYEILGKRDDDYIPPHILDDIRKDDLTILETGKSIVNRVELVPRGNGFVDWSNTTKKPLYNQNGEICGIIGVTRPFNQGTTSLSMNEELGGALQRLHQDYRDNIAITDLAKTANLSLSSFLRKFKTCFGMTPKTYLRHLRVQEACHLIVRTTRTFAEISHHCGFADQAHFSREFSRIMKEPPSAYRSRYRI
jgi:PAS domain S-box-containing protein